MSLLVNNVSKFNDWVISHNWLYSQESEHTTPLRKLDIKLSILCKTGIGIERERKFCTKPIINGTVVQITLLFSNTSYFHSNTQIYPRIFIDERKVSLPFRSLCSTVTSPLSKTSYVQLPIRELSEDGIISS